MKPTIGDVIRAMSELGRASEAQILARVNAGHSEDERVSEEDLRGVLEMLRDADLAEPKGRLS